MDRQALLRLVARLGREFVRLELRDHAKRLRLYYFALEKNLLTGQGRGLDVKWNEKLVIEWMGLLQLPPYDDLFPVLAPGAPCPQCAATQKAEAASVFTEITLPSGAKTVCAKCGARWLTKTSVADDDSAA
jgi:hypothetical protein